MYSAGRSAMNRRPGAVERKEDVRLRLSLGGSLDRHRTKVSDTCLRMNCTFRRPGYNTHPSGIYYEEAELTRRAENVLLPRRRTCPKPSACTSSDEASYAEGL